MRIVQIAPFIGPGSGVAGVAWNLERELQALGVSVERFTLGTALRGRPLAFGKTRLRERIHQLRRVVWFSIVGTHRARAYLADRPDAIAICHSNVMTGDIYVNHGVVLAAMRARGTWLWRVVRNPVHSFTHVRDLMRYRSSRHRAVVVLAPSEVDTLRKSFGKVKPEIVLIPNGVDLDVYRIPSPQERAAARATFQLDAEDRVALFIGHEFERKGLPDLIDAMAYSPTVLLLVVGGDQAMVDAARAYAERVGVASRILFLGRRSGLTQVLAAADMFVMPSYYESSGLVFLEALASGVPVIATAVGIAPEVIENGVNGFIVPHDPEQTGDRMEEIAASEPGSWATAARESVAGYSWRETARRYLALAERLAAEKAVA